MAIRYYNLADYTTDQIENLFNFLNDSSRYSKFFEEMHEVFQNHINEWVKLNTQDNFKMLVANEIQSIITSLLLGNIEVLKKLNLDTDYTFDSLNEIRSKIFEAFGDEITKALLKEKENEINDLKKQLSYYRTDNY